ncbi:DUF1561 family protein, partial [Bartonella sp. A05]|uniref:DUF1561 family protein n=1 Tax=Bartonella sp. A05 TaxID=2967261 RepID=UPI0022A97E43
NISVLNGSEGPVVDRRGNYLRVMRYGANWGVPYTVKPDYLKSDTKYSPTSQFVLSYDMERWNRYVYGNLGDTLTYCPAPGQKLTDAKTRVKRTLPPNFELNREWRKRLYDIATSTTYVTRAAGICGPCLLHTYQMIAELQEFYPERPFSSGGYFFDTRQDRDPMISFSQRSPSTYTFMQNVPRMYGVRLTPTETEDERSLRMVIAMTQAVLGRYTWNASNIATNRNAIINSIQELFNAPIGTIWIGLVDYLPPGERREGHAVPIIRGRNGLYVIPTNVIMPPRDFVMRTAESTTPEGVYDLLSLHQPGAQIPFFATLRLTGVEQRPLNVVMSQRNCTGEGDDRRGNKEFPRSSTVNQCLSGRCPL